VRDVFSQELESVEIAGPRVLHFMVCLELKCGVISSVQLCVLNLKLNLNVLWL